MSLKLSLNTPGTGDFSSIKISLPSSQNEGSNQQLKLELNQALDDPAQDDAVTLSKTLQGQPESVSPALKSIQDYLDVAENASTRIYQARYDQLQYAAEAENYALGDPRLDRLNTLAQESQEEIDTISANATYNGQNVLQGATLSTSNFDGSDLVVFGVASGVGQTADLGLDLTDPANASANADALEEILLGADVYASGVASNRDGANVSSLVEKPASSADPDKPKDVEEAEAEAQKTLQQIKEKLTSPSTDSLILKNLVKA